MKILMICHGSPGGSSRAAVSLANALAKAGHRLMLFTVFKPIWRVRSSVQLNVLNGTDAPEVSSLSQLWNEKTRNDFIRTLENCIVHFKPEVVHFHYVRPFSRLVNDCLSGISLPGPRLVGSIHGTDLSLIRDDATALSELSDGLNRIDSVHTVSSSMRQTIEVHLALDTPTRVIPNLIPEEWFCDSLELKIPPCPELVHVSNYRLIKNSGALYSLLALLKGRLDFKVKLVGEGEFKGPLVKQLKTLLGNERVKATGLVANVREQLIGTQLSLSTSREESFSLALLESMACGIPPIASRVGGVPELVDDGVEGVLFDLNDLSGAADRIVQLMNNPLEYGKFSRRARSKAALYSEANLLREYEKLYVEN